MSANLTITDSMLIPHRVTAFREPSPNRPEGITICLGPVRIETSLMEWRPISEAIERALADLAPARPIPARKNLNTVDVSGIAYQGESA